jgi:OmcA/MtrC family decaheme c-type cytochrome
MLAFIVTGDKLMERRMVVSDAKCESCHVNFSIHGSNRKSIQYCNTCHQPGATDEEELRPGAEEQGIHMKYMVHKIHAGAELQNGYVVAGHNQSVHDYSNLHYVGDLRNCDACHVNDSQQISLPEGLLPTKTPQEWWDPIMPIGAACIGCHDSDASAAHIFSNTVMFGEACGACHGEGKHYSVDRVHAR